MSRDSNMANRVLATVGLMLATLMNTLDSTIANVALPHIQGSVSAAQDQITWVLTSYIVGTALMTPLSGWVALKIGRKPMFLISIVGFVAASVLCGIATSLPEIVLFRLLQGCAGASMMPLSQASMLDTWPPEDLPKIMAVWSAAVMVGPILGPTLGGYLTEHYSWRWVFYINLPVGVLAFALVYLFMERDPGGRERPFDMLGFCALVLFTGALQLMLDRGPSQDWFQSREIWAEAVVAVCAFYVFVMQSLTAKHPFFPRELVQDRNFTTAVVFAVFLSAVLFSTSAMIPSFMQNLLGYSAFQSGMASMPRGVGSLVAFALVPSLTRRFGARRLMFVGLTMSVAVLWRMGHFDLGMTDLPIKVTGFFQGIAFGLMFSPLSVVMYTTLAQRWRTDGAVFSNVMRSLGGSIGIAALQALLIRQSATAHEGLAARIIPSDPVIRWTLPDAFSGAPGALERLNAEVTRQGTMIGYDAIFGWMAIASACLLPLLLLMRPPAPGSRERIEVHAD
jgi:DHA2 family multidrug resistance protein